jgi:hypothetical protein
MMSATTRMMTAASTTTMAMKRTISITGLVTSSAASVRPAVSQFKGKGRPG